MALWYSKMMGTKRIGNPGPGSGVPVRSEPSHPRLALATAYNIVPKGTLELDLKQGLHLLDLCVSK